MAVKAKGFITEQVPGDNTTSGTLAKEVEDYITALDATPDQLTVSCESIGHRLFTVVTIETSTGGG